ncbi:leucyl aminopeptidase [Candidatus Woesearchaeota archaeon]|nr:leucyl aminopeptidase [Candidatus Woesearchaeota archaeon]
MNVTIKTGPVEHIQTGTIIVPLFKNVVNKTDAFTKIDDLFQGALSTAVHEDEEFHVNSKSFTTLSLGKVHAKRIILASLGDPEKVTLDALRKFAGKCVKGLSQYMEKDFMMLSPCYALKDISVEDAYAAFTEGAVLSSYLYDEYKTQTKAKNKKPQQLFFYLDANENHAIVQKAVERATLVCTHANIVKDLANGPSNVVTPAYLVETARKYSKKFGLRLTVLNDNDMRKQGMNCLLAVSQGSSQKPALIALEYRGAKGKAPIALVGKGVTFDSGGINLKPTGSIENMKEDMTGAAVVLNTICAAAALQLPLNLVCIVPTVENMPSGTAVKPGDVVKASNGKTVEIMNTDAEGRLILSDALVYACKYKPEAIIDVATLTGAAFVALGKSVTPVLGNDSAIISQLIAAGTAVHERCWELPLFEDFSDSIKGDVADIKNLGGAKGEAGTIAGAVFLKEFVGDTKWAHLDIGGTSWTDSENDYLQKGSTGVGVRLLVKYLENVAASDGKKE